MKTLFNIDGPVATFLTKVFNLMWLNILTIATSIPIFTIGASLTAMDYVLLKIVRDEETSVSKAYFHAFKQNFKEATLLWLIWLIPVVIGILDLMVLHASAKKMSSAYIAIFFVVAMLLMLACMNTFALLSRYTYTKREALRNAGALLFAYFPKMLVTAAVIVVLGLLFRQYNIRVIPLYLMFGLTIPGGIHMWFLSGIFRKLEGDDPKKKEQDDEELEELDFGKIDEIKEIGQHEEEHKTEKN